MWKPLLFLRHSTYGELDNLLIAGDIIRITMQNPSVVLAYREQRSDAESGRRSRYRRHTTYEGRGTHDKHVPRISFSDPKGKAIPYDVCFEEVRADDAQQDEEENISTHSLRSMWEVESDASYLGGLIYWREAIRLRNCMTGLYLCSTGDNDAVTLTPSRSDATVFSFLPRKFHSGTVHISLPLNIFNLHGKKWLSRLELHRHSSQGQRRASTAVSHHLLHSARVDVFLQQTRYQAHLIKKVSDAEELEIDLVHQEERDMLVFVNDMLLTLSRIQRRINETSAIPLSDIREYVSQIGSFLRPRGREKQTIVMQRGLFAVIVDLLTKIWNLPGFDVQAKKTGSECLRVLSRIVKFHPRNGLEAYYHLHGFLNQLKKSGEHSREILSFFDKVFRKNRLLARMNLSKEIKWFFGLWKARMLPGFLHVIHAIMDIEDVSDSNVNCVLQVISEENELLPSFLQNKSGSVGVEMFDPTTKKRQTYANTTPSSEAFLSDVLRIASTISRQIPAEKRENIKAFYPKDLTAIFFKQSVENIREGETQRISFSSSLLNAFVDIHLSGGDRSLRRVLSSHIIRDSSVAEPRVVEDETTFAESEGSPVPKEKPETENGMGKRTQSAIFTAVDEPTTLVLDAVTSWLGQQGHLSGMNHALTKHILECVLFFRSFLIVHGLSDKITTSISNLLRELYVLRSSFRQTTSEFRPAEDETERSLLLVSLQVCHLILDLYVSNAVREIQDSRSEEHELVQLDVFRDKNIFDPLLECIGSTSTKWGKLLLSFLSRVHTFPEEVLSALENTISLPKALSHVNHIQHLLSQLRSPEMRLPGIRDLVAMIEPRHLRALVLTDVYRVLGVHLHIIPFIYANNYVHEKDFEFLGNCYEFVHYFCRKNKKNQKLMKYHVKTMFRHAGFRVGASQAITTIAKADPSVMRMAREEDIDRVVQSYAQMKGKDIVYFDLLMSLVGVRGRVISDHQIFIVDALMAEEVLQTCFSDRVDWSAADEAELGFYASLFILLHMCVLDRNKHARARIGSVFTVDVARSLLPRVVINNDLFIAYFSLVRDVHFLDIVYVKKGSSVFVEFVLAFFAAMRRLLLLHLDRYRYEDVPFQKRRECRTLIEKVYVPLIESCYRSHVFSIAAQRDAWADVKVDLDTLGERHPDLIPMLAKCANMLHVARSDGAASQENIQQDESAPFQLRRYPEKNDFSTMVMRSRHLSRRWFTKRTVRGETVGRRMGLNDKGTILKVFPFIPHLIQSATFVSPQFRESDLIINTETAFSVVKVFVDGFMNVVTGNIDPPTSTPDTADEISRDLENPPSHDPLNPSLNLSAKERVLIQDEFVKDGKAVDVVFALVCSGVDGLVQQGLCVGVALLDGGNREAQRAFEHMLTSDPRASKFLQELEIRLETTRGDIKLFARTGNHEYIFGVKRAVEILRFLQLLCERHNTALQTILGDSTMMKSDSLVNHCQRLFYAAAKRPFGRLCPLVCQSLQTMTDMVQGPFAPNQIALASSKMCVLFDRLLLGPSNVRKTATTSLPEGGTLDGFPPSSESKWFGTLRGDSGVEPTTYSADNRQNAEAMEYLAENGLNLRDLVFILMLGMLERSESTNIAELFSTMIGDGTIIDIIGEYVEIPESRRKKIASTAVTPYDGYQEKRNEVALHAVMYLLTLHDYNMLSYKTYQRILKMPWWQKKVQSIEVVRDGHLEKAYFPVLPKCEKFEKQEHEKEFLMKMQKSSPQNRVQSLLNYSDRFIQTVNHFEAIGDNPVFRPVTTRWSFLKKLSFTLAILINMVILFGYQSKSDDESPSGIYMDSRFELPLSILGALQLILSLFLMISYVVVFGELVISGIWETQLENKNTAISYEDTYEGHPRTIFFRLLCAGLLFLDPLFVFELLYVTASALGMFYHPFFYAILLFDLVRQSHVLQSVTRSVSKNRKGLALTFLLTLIVVYVFSFFAFIFFRDQFKILNSSENVCETFADCLVHYADYGLRSGGFWEDVFPSYERKWRSLFDLVFFTVVVLILLNLLFGVIIDTFSELRQDRQAASTAWESNCFICGLDRMVFDRLPVGFKRHRDEEHCPFHYLYFIAYVVEKDDTEFTGMEQYLFERIQKKDASFFPIHRAMALKDRPLHVH
eukprot:TRINITY_DN361_c0_g1_i13.p1 TRINITY_DN361_c0_g1~~TRINITY_DN361_c0_g1_i13.p1  ORF type:complete len:2119 (+),score=497.57 TRINITY_DN361_c0_g1_i13:4248-10604(+)